MSIQVKSWCVAVTALLLAACGGGNSSSKSDSKTPNTDFDAVSVCDASSNLAKEIVRLVNESRIKGAQCGDKEFKPTKDHAVTWDSQLCEAALAHSKDMASLDFFSHVGSDSSEFWDRTQKVGYLGQPTGENISAGWGGRDSVQEVHDGWMKSPGHCKGVMNPNSNQVGLAFVKTKEGNASHQYYWTEVFGAKTPKSASVTLDNLNFQSGTDVSF